MVSAILIRLTLYLFIGKSHLLFPPATAYNAFVRYGRQSPKWCASHKLNYKALLRAVSIRKQLAKYLERFNIPVESCEGDGKRLRKCLVTGYFKNAARMMPDGTYRSVRENAVSRQDS